MRVERLLQEYTPLVQRTVGRFLRKLPRHVRREDLYAAGMAGLWDAIRKNQDAADVDGNGFEWYARIRIRGAVIDELRHQDWLPRRTREKDSLPVVVHYSDLDIWDQRTAALDFTFLNGEDHMLESEQLRYLTKLVDQLPERYRFILIEHYIKERPFLELAEELGVSAPRISQLNSRMLKQLRLAVLAFENDSTLTLEGNDVSILAAAEPKGHRTAKGKNGKQRDRE